MNKTVLILGGYGNTGRLLAEWLLLTTEVHLVLAGRSETKAKILAGDLRQRFPGKTVTGIRLDAANFNELLPAFQRVHLVVVAASTTALVENVATAALQARIDYFDMQLSSPHKINQLRQLENEIIAAGCCFITDGGFHPGVPAVLIRYAATQFESLTQADVASVIQVNWAALSFSEETKIEFIRELQEYQLLVWRQRQWRELSWYHAVKEFDFGQFLGKRACVPFFLEELRYIPEQFPALQDSGFFIAGFHWWIDYVIMPLSFFWLKLSPKLIKPLSQLFWWNLVKTSHPPFGTSLLLEATGLNQGQSQTLRVQLFHEDAYQMTAIPVIACLLQYLDGTIRKPGLWWQGNIVVPTRMLRDMEKLGITVTVRVDNLQPMVNS